MLSRVASRRHHALTGAGIIALGAGTVLCIRAYKARMSSTASKSLQLEPNVGGSAVPQPTRSQDTEEVANSTVGTQAKTPCEGCDCGLGEEPGPLEGTMNAYERHVIICSGDDIWPKFLESEEASMAESLHNMCLGAGLMRTKKMAKEAENAPPTVTPNRVKITACTEPSRGPPGTTDVIVYPEGVIYTLSVNDIDRLNTFVKIQLIEQRVATELKPIHVPYQKMVLVCTHGSRDKRCGRAGPQVLEAMSTDLKARGVGPEQVALRGSSHFGGHKYAGVLIIYPQGDWYGLVNKKNAGEILDKCIFGTMVMKPNWRGNMSNPGRKAEEAAPVTSTAAPDTQNTPKAEASPEPRTENGTPAVPHKRRDSVDSTRGEGA